MHSIKTKWLVGILIVIVIVAAILASTRQPKTSAVKIGIINPLSGPAGNMGEGVANDIKLASSTSVALLFEDDQCDAKKAISSYLKLRQEGVHIFYLSCSGSVMALAPLAKQNGDLIVTAYAGSAEIRKTGDEVIRFVPDAISIAGAMADYIAKLPSTSKTGLLYEEQDYAKSAAMALEDRLGARIIAAEQYSAEDTTFRTEITKLKGAGIDTLLYVPTSDKAAQLVLKEMQTLGYKPDIVGDVNLCAYPFSPKDFGMKTVCFDAGLPTETEGYREFIASYKSKFGKEPNAVFYDAITYDIITLIDQFATTHSSTDLVPALKSYFLAGVHGVMADYSFTPDGEVIATDYLRAVEK